MRVLLRRRERNEAQDLLDRFARSCKECGDDDDYPVQPDSVGYGRMFTSGWPTEHNVESGWWLASYTCGLGHEWILEFNPSSAAY